MNSLLILFIFIPVLIFLLLILNYLFSPYKPDAEKLSLYECGFSTVHGQTRSTFHINFYIIAMLFLIFDLEIILLFPLPISLFKVGLYGFFVAVIFFIILTVGFALEIGYGAISLEKLNINNYKNNKLNPSNILNNFYNTN